jgi:hypothetical protein
MFIASLSPFEWIYQHLALIGWPAVCIAAWTTSKWFEHALSIAKKTVAQVDTLTTNHFPHMEASLARQDAFLENIDKNIARMADKL